MKRNVLIVDDEAAFRGFMAEVLDNAGYGAISASDCTEALASARNGGVDGIITGMVMPDMSGAELITRLRTGGSDAPIIAMTGLRKAMRIWPP
jgi:DNA-binding response OmpR family regulator